MTSPPVQSPYNNHTTNTVDNEYTGKRGAPPVFSANRKSSFNENVAGERQGDFISKRKTSNLASAKAEEDYDYVGDGSTLKRNDSLGNMRRSRDGSESGEKRVGMYFTNSGNTSFIGVQDFVNGSNTNENGGLNRSENVGSSGSIKAYRQPSDIQIKSKKGLRLMKQQQQLNSNIKTMIVLDPSMTEECYRDQLDITGVGYDNDGTDTNRNVIRITRPALGATRGTTSTLGGSSSTAAAGGTDPNAFELRCTEILQSVPLLQRKEPYDYLQSQMVQDARNVFVYGCNTSLLLADVNVTTLTDRMNLSQNGCNTVARRLSRPSRWPSWRMVRQMMKTAFEGFSKIYYELTVSISLLQEDMVMDLLLNEGEGAGGFQTLQVAESPLFGYVPDGMMYVHADQYDTFKSLLCNALEKADRHYNNKSRRQQTDSLPCPVAPKTVYNKDGTTSVQSPIMIGEEEDGIVLLMCVLKQIKPSASNSATDHSEIMDYVAACEDSEAPLDLTASSEGDGTRSFGDDYDVVVSGLFISGVGDGIVHYNRILDKNPAEPRVLFQFVLHRSVHSNAIFTLYDTDPENRSGINAVQDKIREVYVTLNSLSRFGEVRLRKPWRGNVKVFVSNSKKKLQAMQGSVDDLEVGKQRIKQVQFMERLELMSIDAEELLKDCIGAPLKTYILHVQ
ncbi:hypothetical protein AGDE_13589 [Angomonas deanei]|nr:hypothetical protein AGDE_13589 [Angomonas deanei]|eukprot:EPY22119.1 hypothetical protein AGDE_13589 [Angomonas deanei]